MGESAISKQLEAFMKMYMDDKKEHDRQQQELKARIEELSKSVAAARSESFNNREHGSN